MSDAKPAPYPADTRAKGWRFELDLERVRQSDTWALTQPEARPWLFMLWCEAWLQTPCGSLPSDDALVAARIGMPSKLWAKHRATLMRGWAAADDGRLYHQTITELVLAMLMRKDAEKTRKAEYRARMDAERDALSRGTDVGQTRDGHGTDATGTGTGLKDLSTPSESHPPAKAVRGKTPTVPCPYGDIVDAYHAVLPSLPRVLLRDGKTWTARQKAMREMWGWVLSSRKSDGTRRAESADDALAWLRGYFARASENDFLMGRTSRSDDHKNWRCDLDFLLTERGIKQVVERTLESA